MKTKLTAPATFCEPVCTNFNFINIKTNHENAKSISYWHWKINKASKKGSFQVSKTKSVGVPIKEILKHEFWSQEWTLEKL